MCVLVVAPTEVCGTFCLALAIGISTGVLLLLVIVIVVIVMCKRSKCRCRNSHALATGDPEVKNKTVVAVGDSTLSSYTGYSEIPANQSTPAPYLASSTTLPVNDDPDYLHLPTIETTPGEHSSPASPAVDNPDYLHIPSHSHPALFNL